MDGFSFSTDVRIRFAETDAQGIAHHASFVVWLEVARVAYLARHAGGYQAIRDRGIEALTTEVSSAITALRTSTRRSRSGRAARTCAGLASRYEYRVERDGELVADGYTRHATVDRETYRPTRVPAWLAEAIATAEASSA